MLYQQVIEQTINTEQQLFQCKYDGPLVQR